MTPAEANELRPGIYQIQWQNGTKSMAAIGAAYDGTRWLAAVDRARPSTKDRHWREVKRAVFVIDNEGNA